MYNSNNITISSDIFLKIFVTNSTIDCVAKDKQIENDLSKLNQVTLCFISNYIQKKINDLMIEQYRLSNNQQYAHQLNNQNHYNQSYHNQLNYNQSNYNQSNYNQSNYNQSNYNQSHQHHPNHGQLFNQTLDNQQFYEEPLYNSAFATYSNAQTINTNHQGKLGPPHVQFDLTSLVGQITIDRSTNTLMSNSGFSTVKANCFIYSGKFQYEVLLLTKGIMQLGWASTNGTGSQNYFTIEKGVGDTQNSYSYDGNRQKKWNITSSDYGEKYEIYDVISCCIDLDESTVSFYRNGKFLGIAFSKIQTGSGIVYFPAISLAFNEKIIVNFGSSKFKYPIDGYQPLEIQNQFDIVKANMLIEWLFNLILLKCQTNEEEIYQSSMRSDQLNDNQNSPTKSKSNEKNPFFYLTTSLIMEELENLLINEYIIETCLFKHLILFHTKDEIHCFLDIIWSLLNETNLELFFNSIFLIIVYGYQFSQHHDDEEILFSELNYSSSTYSTYSTFQPSKLTNELNFVNQKQNLYLFLLLIQHRSTRHYLLNNVLFKKNLFFHLLDTKLIFDNTILQKHLFPNLTLNDLNKHLTKLKANNADSAIFNDPDDEANDEENDDDEENDEENNYVCYDYSSKSSNQSAYRSTNQLTNQLTNQSTNELTNELINESIKRSNNQSTNRSINRSTNKSANKSTIKSTNQNENKIWRNIDLENSLFELESLQNMILDTLIFQDEYCRTIFIEKFNSFLNELEKQFVNNRTTTFNIPLSVLLSVFHRLCFLIRNQYENVTTCFPLEFFIDPKYCPKSTTRIGGLYNHLNNNHQKEISIYNFELSNTNPLLLQVFILIDHLIRLYSIGVHKQLGKYNGIKELLIEFNNSIQTLNKLNPNSSKNQTDSLNSQLNDLLNHSFLNQSLLNQSFLNQSFLNQSSDHSSSNNISSNVHSRSCNQSNKQLNKSNSFTNLINQQRSSSTTNKLKRRTSYSSMNSTAINSSTNQLDKNRDNYFNLTRTILEKDYLARGYQYALLNSIVFTLDRRQDLIWLLKIILQTLDSSSSSGCIFCYLPHYYLITCFHLCTALRFYFNNNETNYQPFNDSLTNSLTTCSLTTCPLTGSLTTNSSLSNKLINNHSSLNNNRTQDLEFKQVLKQICHFITAHFCDERIVNNDHKELIAQNLTSLITSKQGLHILENISIENRLNLIKKLVKPYENRPWTHSNWILLKFWRGNGFAFKKETFIKLSNSLSDENLIFFTKNEQQIVNDINPSIVFQQLLCDYFNSNPKQAYIFLTSLLNQLNWSFSEFVGMFQDIQNSTIKQECYLAKNMYKICSTCYDLSNALLRVLEMIIHYNASLILTNNSYVDKKCLTTSELFNENYALNTNLKSYFGILDDQALMVNQDEDQNFTATFADTINSGDLNVNNFNHDNFCSDLDSNLVENHFKTNFDSNFETNFETNFDSNFNPNFNPNFNSNFNPNFNSNFNENFDDNFNLDKHQSISKDRSFTKPEIKPEIYEILLQQLCSISNQILNRITMSSKCFKYVRQQLTNSDSMNEFSILSSVVAILIELIVKNERTRYLTLNLLINDLNFQLSSYLYLIDETKLDKCSTTDIKNGGQTSDNHTDNKIGHMIRNKLNCKTRSNFTKYLNDDEFNELKRMLIYVISFNERNEKLKSFDDYQEEDLCTICYANKKTALFIPCYHKSCGSCITIHFLGKNSECFFCKIPLDKVFLSGANQVIYPSSQKVKK